MNAWIYGWSTISLREEKDLRQIYATQQSMSSIDTSNLSFGMEKKWMAGNQCYYANTFLVSSLASINSKVFKVLDYRNSRMAE